MTLRDSKGRFKKGNKGFWLGKKFGGWKLSEETKKRMSLARKGEKRPYQSGEKNGNWRGGVSKINKPRRRLMMETIEYKNWRRAVFERDGYACVMCGDDRGRNLEADHIVPVALKPELMLETENGRTLCKKCHEKVTVEFNKMYWKNQFGTSQAIPSPSVVYGERSG